MPKMSTVSENGMIATVATAVSIEIAGASANSQPIDVRGRNCSLNSELADVGHRLQDPERARRGWGRSGAGSGPSSLRSTSRMTGTSWKTTAKISDAP